MSILVSNLIVFSIPSSMSQVIPPTKIDGRKEISQQHQNLVAIKDVHFKGDQKVQLAATRSKAFWLPLGTVQIEKPDTYPPKTEERDSQTSHQKHSGGYTRRDFASSRRHLFHRSSVLWFLQSIPRNRFPLLRKRYPERESFYPYIFVITKHPGGLRYHSLTERAKRKQLYVPLVASERVLEVDSEEGKGGRAGCMVPLR